MTGWWRRNAGALGALVLLIPAGVWAFDTIEFGAVRNAERTVAEGEQISVGDWTFAAPELTSLAPDEVGAPAGSDPVVVRITVMPGDDVVSCMKPVLVDPATGREWWDATALDWSRDDGETTYCPPPVDDEGVSATGFDLTTLVLLPADAPDRLVVQFSGYLSADDVTTDIRTGVTR